MRREHGQPSGFGGETVAGGDGGVDDGVVDRRGKAIEEHLHRFRIDVGQHERESVVPQARFQHDISAGLDGREDVAKM